MRAIFHFQKSVVLWGVALGVGLSPLISVTALAQDAAAAPADSGFGLSQLIWILIFIAAAVAWLLVRSSRMLD